MKRIILISFVFFMMLAGCGAGDKLVFHSDVYLNGYLFRPKQQHIASRREAPIQALNVCILNKSKYKIKVMEEIKTGYCCASRSWIFVQYPGQRQLYVFSDCRGSCAKILKVVAYDVKSFKYIGEISREFSVTPSPCIWEITTDDFPKTKHHSSRPLKAGFVYKLYLMRC